jgi:hypothetical protein
MLLSSRLLAQRQMLLPAIARGRRLASLVPNAKKDKKKDEGGKIHSAGASVGENTSSHPHLHCSLSAKSKLLMVLPSLF